MTKFDVDAQSCLLQVTIRRWSPGCIWIYLYVCTCKRNRVLWHFLLLPAQTLIICLLISVWGPNKPDQHEHNCIKKWHCLKQTKLFINTTVLKSGIVWNKPNFSVSAHTIQSVLFRIRKAKKIYYSGLNTMFRNKSPYRRADLIWSGSSTK
jgi:hypothetical protein